MAVKCTGFPSWENIGKVFPSIWGGGDTDPSPFFCHPLASRIPGVIVKLSTQLSEFLMRKSCTAIHSIKLPYFFRFPELLIFRDRPVSGRIWFGLALGAEKSALTRLFTGDHS